MTVIGEDKDADIDALHRECQQHIAEIERLRAALKPFALYADQNDLTERDPRGAIEVPISDLIQALKVYGPSVHEQPPRASIINPRNVPASAAWDEVMQRDDEQSENSKGE